MSEENYKEFESLFQRASENYPLNTDSANWNAVLEKLEKEGNQKGILLRKRLIYLMILLAVSIFSAIMMNLYRNWTDQNKSTIVPTLNQQLEVEKKLLKKLTDAVYDKVVDSITQKKQYGKIITVTTSNNMLPKTKHSSSKISFDSQLFGIKNKNIPIQSLNKNVVTTSPQELPLIASNPSTVLTSNQDSKKLPKILADTVEVAARSLATNSKKQPDSSFKETITAPIIKAKKAAFEKYFYTGILYAADKSSIKFEPSKGVGYSWALAFGYQFSKRFSIESGIHIEKKEYYTTGEHFDKSILPATGKILWIESENKLLEIPITLKTDLFVRKHHQIFGSMGVSSYLINNESYEYEEELNGVIQNEFVQFTKNSSSLFATTNLSIGYEYKFISGLRLRVEPYLNLPLSGIGKGKEPVLSKGVYFGLIYNFHKKKLKQ
jgi:hypothetical protein